MPKGVECPHAGYVNLALTYADYFDLIPGMDASSLTSSLGYDGSISEMYSAWVSGCAVVMLTKEEIRSGPDLVPVLREAEVTVLFCPPVLLSTLTPTPEVDLPYPLVPLHRAGGRSLSQRARGAVDAVADARSSTPTAPQRRAPTRAARVCGRGAHHHWLAVRQRHLRHPGGRMNSDHCPMGRLESSASVGCTLRAGTATCRSKPRRSSSRTLSSAASTAPGTNAKSTSRTQRVHFLGRIDAQLKVRGHRVEAQAVEDILQTQFSEIEAAVLDYQNEALVAFVAAPSICEGKISVVAPAPAEWAARVTATLAKQLPAPSVPTRIFLVEKFVMKPVSGKIDRKCLPNLSHLLRDAEPEAEDIRCDTPASARDTRARRRSTPPDAEAGMDPECEEVLAICQGRVRDADGMGRWIR